MIAFLDWDSNEGNFPKDIVNFHLITNDESSSNIREHLYRKDYDFVTRPETFGNVSLNTLTQLSLNTLDIQNAPAIEEVIYSIVDILKMNKVINLCVFDVKQLKELLQYPLQSNSVDNIERYISCVNHIINISYDLSLMIKACYKIPYKNHITHNQAKQLFGLKSEKDIMLTAKSRLELCYMIYHTASAINSKCNTEHEYNTALSMTLKSNNKRNKKWLANFNNAYRVRATR